jgi:ribosomal protein S18 acetylase RimI-like enzyme
MWRSAQSENDVEIIEMSRELYREDPSTDPVPDEHMKRTLATLRTEPVRGLAIVLELDKKIEGYALLVSFWSNELGGEVCNIDELYVRPKFRNQGHASKLIRKLIDEAPSWQFKPVAIALEVTPKNSKALALYSRLGFKAAKNSQMRLRLSNSRH